MIISCPSCSTKFRVPDEMIGAGKNMTCAKCQHKWFFSLTPVEEPPAAPSPEEIERAVEKIVEQQAAAPAPEPAKAEAAPTPHPPAKPHNIKRAWALMILLIAAIFGTVIFSRQNMVAVWPPSARIFELVGMPVPVLGGGLSIKDLSFDVPRAEKIDENTGEKIVLPAETMTLKGQIANISADKIHIPPMLAEIKDESGAVLTTEKFKAPAETILPGEVIPFTAILPLYPDKDVKILVRFGE